MNFRDSGTDLQVVNFILQTIDPSNSVMRRTCFQSSMTTLNEVVRVYPMVAMNDAWTRLAVGDVIVETNNPSIRIYDMQRYYGINDIIIVHNGHTFPGCTYF